MIHRIDHPVWVFATSLTALWFCAWLGAAPLRSHAHLNDALRNDFGVILAASLTLLGLIIGFSFSMAISRYDQRKNYEEAEANAIGTEYARADLLSGAERLRLKALLRDYTEQRILFYDTTDERLLRQIAIKTGSLQGQLWSAVEQAAIDQPNPILALVVSGANDVLNSQGYTQSAWWNRIPLAAWALMGLISIICNVMVGYGARKLQSRSVMLLLLPFVVSISFFLIVDIDSPRGGIIKVVPQNLLSTLDSMRMPGN